MNVWKGGRHGGTLSSSFFTSNSSMCLTSRGELDVNFVTLCLRYGSVWLTERENTSECSERSVEALMFGSLTDIQYDLLQYLCLKTERGFGRKHNNQWLLFKITLLVRRFTLRRLSQTRLSTRVVVQDGAALVSVVLQIAQSRVYSFSAIYDLVQKCSDDNKSALKFLDGRVVFRKICT